MKHLARMHTVAAALTLTAFVACGSSAPPPGFGTGADGGTSARSGGGSGSGGTGTNPGGGAASSGGAAGAGPGFVGSGDSGAGDAQAPCVSGSTQSCCSGGAQTCSAAGEIGIPTWGPCLDSTGAVVTCSPNDQCVPGETSRVCDAGVDASSPPICTDKTVSTEPKILVGYSPAMGQTVGMTGQIKVWVNDENAPFIAPGEQVDNTTGAVTTPGTRTATASDGLLDEPGLYIAPATPTNGGTPHFPQLIKGSYNNSPPTRSTFNGGAAIDPVPAGATLSSKYTGEFVWDVSALGLGPGTFTAVFSVHDGDKDRAIGCVTIVITS